MRIVPNGMAREGFPARGNVGLRCIKYEALQQQHYVPLNLLCIQLRFEAGSRTICDADHRNALENDHC